MAAQLGHAEVGDSAFGEGGLERATGEVRHAPRPGRRAHVHQTLDAVEPEKLDQLVERPRGVPYGQDDLSDGSTRGTSTRLTYVCPLYWKEPEKR